MSDQNQQNQQTITIPKTILITGKFLQFISLKLGTRFAAKLFVTPLKHKLPKREINMDKNSKQELIKIPKINKTINIYKYGEGDKKILLAHGWSGRGTQLVKIAEKLTSMGYKTISFDAPAHGKSPHKITNMQEFIDSIHYINKKYGPFETAVGHSLGGMSLLNAVKGGFQIKKLVTIGSGDMIMDIISDFVKNLQLKDAIAHKMKKQFDKKLGYDLNQLSSSIAAKEVNIPTLVIHDENDLDVPVSCAENIHQNLQNGEIYITQKLGHRKILGTEKVIQKISNFINQ